MNELSIEYVDISELQTYANNAKIHTAEQIEQIKKSIKEFGMNDPIAIWKNNEIIEGHGRLIACTELGMKTVPVIRLDGLTDAQRRAYMLVHNKLTIDTGFDVSILSEELESLRDFDIDMNMFGFEKDELEIDFEEEDYDVDEQETSTAPDTYTLTVYCGSEEEKEQCEKYLTLGGYIYK